MKQSELYKIFEKIRSWLLSLAQHNLSSDNILGVKRILVMIEDLDNLFDQLRPFSIDFNKGEEPKPTD